MDPRDGERSEEEWTKGQARGNVKCTVANKGPTPSHIKTWFAYTLEHWPFNPESSFPPRCPLWRPIWYKDTWWLLMQTCWFWQHTENSMSNRRTDEDTLGCTKLQKLSELRQTHFSRVQEAENKHKPKKSPKGSNKRVTSSAQFWIKRPRCKNTQ